MRPTDVPCRSFPLADLIFARSWERLSGWTVHVDDDDDGEIVGLVPPGCDLVSFAARPPEDGGLLLDCNPQPDGWTRRHGYAEGPVGAFPSLRNALLTLCPLSAAEVAKADAETTEEAPTPVAS